MTTPAAFVDSRLEKGVLLLTVTLREITDEAAGPLRGVLLKAVTTYGAYRVVVDLSHVEQLSSAGLSVLLALKYRLLAVGGKLIIATPPGARVEEILVRDGLQALFETTPDADPGADAAGQDFESSTPPREIRRYSDVSFPPRVR